MKKNITDVENKPKKKNNKKYKKRRIILMIVIDVVVLLALGCALLYYYVLGGMNRDKDFGKNDSALGIDDERIDLTKNSKVINIALFGVDNRHNQFTGLSDSIMIASIDMKNGKIKLTSIARDSRFNIADVGMGKVNSAYSGGGPDRAVKTLNQNLKLDIRDYITINFNGLSKVIEVAGGVEVDITETERVNTNAIMNELTPNSPKIAKAGKVTLTGDQAVSYCRIRKLDSDLYRTDRQRKVLEQLFNKAKGQGIVKLTEVIHTVSPLVKTSLTDTEMISMAKILTMDNVSMDTLRFPHKNTKYESSAKTGWDIIYNLDEASTQIHKFIYDNERPDK